MISQETLRNREVLWCLCCSVQLDRRCFGIAMWDESIGVSASAWSSFRIDDRWDCEAWLKVRVARILTAKTRALVRG